MAAHQIEQVTPRIPSKRTNQASRTWQQPKIRLHNSGPSTPPIVREPVRPHHLYTTRVRVTNPSENPQHAVSALLDTTPVTHAAKHKPPRFRIAGAQPQANTVCRRLFPNSTPAKRPRHATPSFRFSCGRERTQPSVDHSRSHLVDALEDQIGQAQRNLRIFRNGLSNMPRESCFRTAISEGLLFEVSCSHDSLLLLKTYAHHSDEQRIEVAIVATDETLSEQMNERCPIDFSGYLAYIPYPWHARVIEEFDICNSRMLIVAHKVDIFRKEHLALLGNLSINTALDTFLSLESSFPCRQRADNPSPDLGCRFSTLSPHLRVTNLSIFVDFYEPSHQIAVIRDDTGELAVLVTRSAKLEASSRKFVLNSVSVLPYRVLSHVILETLGNKGDDDLRSRVTVSGNEKSYIAFRHEENAEQGNTHLL